MEYAYNEENQVSQKSEFAGSVRQNTYFRYDALHRRTQVGTNSTWWKYTYDTLGRVATQRFTVNGADILTETFAYNNANQVQSIQKVTPENTRTHSYTYDDNGNIATVTVGNKTIRYTYDTAGQLIREDDPNECFTTVWTYDNAGNILTEKVYMYTLGTPNDLLETNDYAYTSTQWGDLLTAYNGNMIYYDGITTSGGFKIGNPTTYYNGTHWTFTWEHGRQLATMSDGTTTWTNTYNADGLRTSRTDGTTTYNYYYEGSQLTSVSDGDVDIWIFYDGNRPVIIKYRDDGDEDTYHYELNLQGDVIAILDSDGNRVVEYAYDAWGNILSITGSEKDTLGQANPLRYRGYVYDNETGMYYCQSRYYDPEIGRFINSDVFAATGQTLIGNNMFAYCGNNPVICADPSGYCAGVSGGLKNDAVYANKCPTCGSGSGGGGIPILLFSWPQSTHRPNTTTFSYDKTLEELQNAVVDKITQSLATSPSEKSNGRMHNHHIVPQNDPRGLFSYSILQEVFPGLGVNDSRNIVAVSSRIHARLHTDVYYDLVNFTIGFAYLSAGTNPSKRVENVEIALEGLRAFIIGLELL